MLDRHLRQWTKTFIERWVIPYLKPLAADHLTLMGFAVGLLACGLIAQGWYIWGLVAFLVNRLADSLDGSLARSHDKATLYGGYLDIVCDMIVYGAVVYAFTLAQPARTPAGAWLLFSFMGTCASYLGGQIAVKDKTIRKETADGVLIESVETTIFIVLICLWPAGFIPLAYALGILCWLTTLQRLLWARRVLRKGKDHGG